MELSQKDFEKRKELEMDFRREKLKTFLDYSGKNIKNLIWTIKHDLFFVYLYINKDSMMITHIIGKIEDPEERLLEILKITIQKNGYS